MSLQPPFELIRYFYTSSFLAANREFSKDAFKFPKLEVLSSLMEPAGDPDRWSISLYVGVAEGTDRKTAPYDFSVSLIGVFFCKFPENLPEEQLLQCKNLLYVNGSSMLYSAVREHILTLSALGPYKKLIIPTYRFAPDDAEESKEE